MGVPVTQSTSAPIRIGISSCLLGNEVRHDGGHKRDRYVTDTLADFFDFVPVCPELEVGMSVPREPVRLVGVASAMGLPLPLTAVQILYVNLATDGLPALALSVDPPATDLMRRRPRSARRSIFTRPVIALTVTGGLVSTGVNAGIFSWNARDFDVLRLQRR